MKTRTEITLEMDRVIVVGRQSSAFQWCNECGRTVSMLALDEAAMRAGRAYQTMLDWAQKGLVHAKRASDGSLLICSRSI